jgi:hypothetical protein
MKAKLPRDKDFIKIQVFPLTNGRVNVTTGTVVAVTLIKCVEDGSAVFAELGATIGMIAGDSYGCATQDVTVTSGKFHMA